MKWDFWNNAKRKREAETTRSKEYRKMREDRRRAAFEATPPYLVEPAKDGSFLLLKKCWSPFAHLDWVPIAKVHSFEAAQERIAHLSRPPIYLTSDGMPCQPEPLEVQP